MKDMSVRFLKKSDIPELLTLERKQWSDNQLPSHETLEKRITNNPTLSIGVFCNHTQIALASLFLKPTQKSHFYQKTTWQVCEEGAVDTKKTRDLFGISLSSINADAADLIFSFFYACCMKDGWRSVYLGSPIPGFKKFFEHNRTLTADDYVNKKHRNNVPYDPQLRYYFNRGFRKIVSIQEGYFPHEKSLNYGVILRGDVPLNELSFVLRILPRTALEKLCKAGIMASRKMFGLKEEYLKLSPKTLA